MSLYIRTKYSVDGYCKCVTCGNVQEIERTDAGHFVAKGGGRGAEFIEENVHVQCQFCNRFNAENSKIAYVKFMEETYGKEKIDELIEEGRVKRNYRVDDYLEIEAHYKERLAAL